MCLKEICTCKWKVTFKCDGQWKLNHPIEEVKTTTCYKCLLLERPRRKIKKTNIMAWFDEFKEKHKFDLRGKCSFCGSFGLVDKLSKEDIAKDKDFQIIQVMVFRFLNAGVIENEWFLFCKDSSCSKLFKKFLLSEPLRSCLITPYRFKKQY
jgi:hypothetical protein